MHNEVLKNIALNTIEFKYIDLINLASFSCVVS